MGGKVVFQEHPRAADLGAGNAARARTLAQCFRMHVKEQCGLLKVERLHAQRPVTQGTAGQASPCPPM